MFYLITNILSDHELTYAYFRFIEYIAFKELERLSTPLHPYIWSINFIFKYVINKVINFKHWISDIPCVHLDYWKFEFDFFFNSSDYHLTSII